MARLALTRWVTVRCRLLSISARDIGRLAGGPGAHLGGAVTGVSAPVRAAEEMCLVVFVDARGVEHVVGLEQGATVPFQDGGMVRKIPSYRGQRHAPGRYWAACTGELVEYESH